MTNELAIKNDTQLCSSLLSPKHYDHYWNLAVQLSKSEIVPAKMRNKPADMIICMELGFQVGLSPLQSIQSIAVINGMPSMFGDSLLAVVQAHRDYEWIKESIVGEGDNRKAVCIVKRKNHDEHTSEFSIDDAKKAKLWGKTGPWSEYPMRMLTWRARGFALRNTFADALKGIKSREEVEDHQEFIPKKKMVETEIMDMINSKPEYVIEDAVIVDQEYGEITQKLDESRHEEIINLFDVKGVDVERRVTALGNFNCEFVSELTTEQADKLIAKLNTMDDI